MVVVPKKVKTSTAENLNYRVNPPENVVEGRMSKRHRELVSDDGYDIRRASVIFGDDVFQNVARVVLGDSIKCQIELKMEHVSKDLFKLYVLDIVTTARISSDRDGVDKVQAIGLPHYVNAFNELVWNGRISRLVMQGWSALVLAKPDVEASLRAAMICQKINKEDKKKKKQKKQQTKKQKQKKRRLINDDDGRNDDDSDDLGDDDEEDTFDNDEDDYEDEDDDEAPGEEVEHEALGDKPAAKKKDVSTTVTSMMHVFGDSNEPIAECVEFMTHVVLRMLASFVFCISVSVASVGGKRGANKFVVAPSSVWPFVVRDVARKDAMATILLMHVFKELNRNLKVNKKSKANKAAAAAAAAAANADVAFG